MITAAPSPTASNGRDGNGKSPDRSGHHKRRAFLRAYAETCNIKLAAQAAGIYRQRHYDWMKDDDYAEAFGHAREEAVETLEAEARRRAVEGWDVPVYHCGRKVGSVRRYSDVLLIFLLKGAKPEKYGNKVAQDNSDEVRTVNRIIIEDRCGNAADPGKVLNSANGNDNPDDAT